MTKPAVKKGLEILSNCQNIDALRRLIVMTIVGRNLRPVSANEETLADDSLSALLSRLPTKTLAEVASISKGKTGIKDALPGPFPLVVTAETRSSADHFDFEGPAVMIPMVSSTGHGDASLKRIHFQDGQYAVGSILAVVHPKDSSVLSARYLHAYLSAFKDELLVSRMVGTANVSLTVAKIGTVPVPLLPIQGQHEIAELMALCDQLEAEQADASVAHARLVETLLGTLTQSTDAADLAANWQRLAEHFDTLFTTEASIDALKHTVLQLAVMGKLVPQDPEDESASELLKRIANERARLEAKGVCKKSKAVGPADQDDRRFDLPDNWAWIRLGHVVMESGAGWSPSCEQRPREGDEWGVLKVSAVSWGAFDPEQNKTLPQSLEPRPEHEVVAGDFLVSRANTAELVARSVVVEDCPRYLMLSDKIVRLKLSELVVGRFINFANSCEQARNYYAAVAGGTSASMKNVSREQILNLVIPLPPLAEQHRIVAKVDELTAFCDHLKADFARACQHQATLADALIESALEAA